MTALYQQIFWSLHKIAKYLTQNYNKKCHFIQIGLPGVVFGVNILNCPLSWPSFFLLLFLFFSKFYVIHPSKATLMSDYTSLKLPSNDTFFSLVLSLLSNSSVKWFVFLTNRRVKRVKLFFCVCITWIRFEWSEWMGKKVYDTLKMGCFLYLMLFLFRDETRRYYFSHLLSTFSRSVC